MRAAATALRNIAAADEACCAVVAAAGAAAPLAEALAWHAAEDPEVVTAVVGALLNLPREQGAAGLAAVAAHLRAAKEAHAGNAAVAAVIDAAVVRLFMSQ